MLNIMQCASPTRYFAHHPTAVYIHKCPLKSTSMLGLLVKLKLTAVPVLPAVSLYRLMVPNPFMHAYTGDHCENLEEQAQCSLWRLNIYLSPHLICCSDISLTFPPSCDYLLAGAAVSPEGTPSSMPALATLVMGIFGLLEHDLSIWPSAFINESPVVYLAL